MSIVNFLFIVIVITISNTVNAFNPSGSSSTDSMRQSTEAVLEAEGQVMIEKNHFIGRTVRPCWKAKVFIVVLNNTKRKNFLHREQCNTIIIYIWGGFSGSLSAFVYSHEK